MRLRRFGGIAGLFCGIICLFCTADYISFGWISFQPRFKLGLRPVSMTPNNLKGVSGRKLNVSSFFKIYFMC